VVNVINVVNVMPAYAFTRHSLWRRRDTSAGKNVVNVKTHRKTKE